MFKSVIQIFQGLSHVPCRSRSLIQVRETVKLEQVVFSIKYVCVMHPQLYIPVISSEHIGVQECCTYLILMTSNINYTLSFHIQFHKKLIIHLVAIYWIFTITKTPFSTEIESIVQQMFSGLFSYGCYLSSLFFRKILKSNVCF